MLTETSKNSNIVSTGGGLGFHNLDKHTTNQEIKGRPVSFALIVTVVSTTVQICRTYTTQGVVYQYSIRIIPCILHHLRWQKPRISTILR